MIALTLALGCIFSMVLGCVVLSLGSIITEEPLMFTLALGWTFVIVRGGVELISLGSIMIALAIALTLGIGCIC